MLKLYFNRDVSLHGLFFFLFVPFIILLACGGASDISGNNVNTVFNVSVLESDSDVKNNQIGDTMVRCQILLVGNPDQLGIQLMIENNLKGNIRIRKRNLIVDGHIDWPIFEIMRNDSPVHFIGRIVEDDIMRDAPSHEEYILLGAGEKVTGQLRLADYYDLSHAGQYRLWYRAVDRQLDGATIIRFQSNEVGFILQR